MDKPSGQGDPTITGPVKRQSETLDLALTIDQAASLSILLRSSEVNVKAAINAHRRELLRANPQQKLQIMAEIKGYELLLEHAIEIRLASDDIFKELNVPQTPGIILPK